MRKQSGLSSKTVVIIGAGPYGLSIAAHLQYLGVRFRIFGRAMERWQTQMPKEMFLKSEGCGSNLSEPTKRHSLAEYCTMKQLPYGNWGKPVSREIFTQYALSFQQTLVPNLEQQLVTTVSRRGAGFDLQLDNDEQVYADHVIVATGLQHTAYIPETIARLPNDVLSHSSEHYDLSGFKGKDVAVIGAGQSALETAALLFENGASPRVMVRGQSFEWNPVPLMIDRSLYKRIRNPRTGLGEGLKLWAYCKSPLYCFYYLPQQKRLTSVKTFLGPAGAWWLKDRVIGKFPILFDHTVTRALARGGRAILQADCGGGVRELTADHVIAATGYKYDLRRLSFLSQDLKSELAHEEQAPRLSRNFESSVTGLYFTGLASANSFGSAMRFLLGADYTARRISAHISRAQSRSSISVIYSKLQPQPAS
jgi:cation diffusion facilitator CzcD-associated flavoprotein CzcO